MSVKFPPTKQESPTREIVSHINQIGLDQAARQYEVSKRTIYRWLKQQGYSIKRGYVKEVEKAS